MVNLAMLIPAWFHVRNAVYKCLGCRNCWMLISKFLAIFYIIPITIWYTESLSRRKLFKKNVTSTLILEITPCNPEWLCASNSN